MMLEHVTDQGKWAVYLLHFEQPVDGRRHYVGITTPDRLGARMIEHTTGRGAALTAQACQQSIPWRLAHVWRTDHPPLERTLIRRAEQPQTCPVCRRITSGVGFRPTQKGRTERHALFGRFSLGRANSFPNELAPQLSLTKENNR